jgi:3-hydroxyacyl-CoA dehydrogenase
LLLSNKFVFFLKFWMLHMSQINPVTNLAVENGIAVITLNSPPVNALSAKVRTGLSEAFQLSISNTDVEAIVLICEGRTFVAGADIKEFGSPMVGPPVPDFESSPKPVIAAIHGTALGGGLELALCAHYRVAVNSALFGLPEVNLGLVPGAGGTQRFPRVVGPAIALELMTSGRHIGASEALSYGLVDELFEDSKLRSGAITFARTVIDEAWPLKKIRNQNEKVEAARGLPEIFDDFRYANARKFRGLLAPEYNIRCIEAAVNLPFDEGLALEQDLFMELVSGPQSAAQRYSFFAKRQCSKIPDIPKDVSLIEIAKVGIIGAGTMGGGIAMNFANVGIPVVLVEQSQDALDRGLDTVLKNYQRTAERGRITCEQVDERMSFISGSTNIDDLTNVDLVIEAAFELMEIKKDIFGKLDKICKQGAILATNTSALDINEIASVTGRPEYVIGLHFFSPANIMALLEIVRTNHTSNQVIATSMALAKQIGKVGVLVGVCPGFVGNRILAQRQREAEKLVLEGATPWDVDRVLYDFGFPMGPFAMGDLAGLDLGWVKSDSKGETLRDMLCEVDRRGQKAGAGFYDYDHHRIASPSPVTEKIIDQVRARKGVNARSISDEEIMERCIFPMINESLKILEEGVAIRASDIDVVWQTGYGWPVYRGGPMWYGDQAGPAKVLEKMRQFNKCMGDDFKPALLLEKLATEGGKFTDLLGFPS